MKKKALILVAAIILPFTLSQSHPVKGPQDPARQIYLAPRKGSVWLGTGITWGGAIGLECQLMEEDGEIYWKVNADHYLDIYVMTKLSWIDWTTPKEVITRRKKASGTFHIPFVDIWVVAFVYNKKHFAGVRPYNIEVEYDVDYWKGGDAPKPARGIPGFDAIPVLMGLGLVGIHRKRRSF